MKLRTYNLKLLLPAVIALAAGCSTVSSQVTPSTVSSNLCNPALTDEDIQNIIAYLHSLQQ